MNTQLNAFDQFRVNYELHPKQYNLTSLVKYLQITEGNLKKKGISAEANVAEGDVTSIYLNKNTINSQIVNS